MIDFDLVLGLRDVCVRARFLIRGLGQDSSKKPGLVGAVGHNRYHLRLIYTDGDNNSQGFL